MTTINDELELRKGDVILAQLYVSEKSLAGDKFVLAHEEDNEDEPIRLYKIMCKLKRRRREDYKTGIVDTLRLLRDGTDDFGSLNAVEIGFMEYSDKKLECLYGICQHHFDELFQLQELGFAEYFNKNNNKGGSAVIFREFIITQRGRDLLSNLLPSPSCS